MNSVTNVIDRLLVSKKLFYALIPLIANFIVGFFGYDPTNKVILTVDAFFGALLLIQGLLDFKYGSASDQTTPATIPVQPPETLMTQVNNPESIKKSTKK